MKGGKSYSSLRGPTGRSRSGAGHSRSVGALARPDDIRFTDALPKTRSGKIMRRLLRDVANQRQLGDTTTLADPTVVESIREASAAGKDEE